MDDDMPYHNFEVCLGKMDLDDEEFEDLSDRVGLAIDADSVVLSRRNGVVWVEVERQAWDEGDAYDDTIDELDSIGLVAV